jgi:nucleotide-binding universal stress UspA family protein
MFRQIMVPLDGSALAEGALVYAERLARLSVQQAERSGTTIHLVRVVAPLFIPAPWGTDMYGAIAQDIEAEMLREAEHLDGLRRRLSATGIQVRAALLTGSLVADLLQNELQEGIDLVVLSSHEESGLARLSLGSMLHGLLHRGPAPLFVVPPAINSAHLEHAIVPLDGSAGAERALALPSHLAPAVVREATPLRVIGAPGETVEAFRYLSSLARRPELAQLSRRCSLECGDPAERIVEPGRGRSVVLTKLRHGTPFHGVSGSISEGVLRNGAAALLIARQGTQTTSDDGSGGRPLPSSRFPRAV